MPKNWFISGSSSGIGKAVLEYALNKGDSVVAALRTPSVLDELKAKYPKQLTVVKIDVTDQALVDAAFEVAKSTFDHIDIVFNNSGVALIGEIESTTEELARKIMDINFWGPDRINRAAVKVFRDFNKPVGGRLVTTTSMCGIKADPATGYYSASKFALEGATQALNAELDPEWNIKITIVEPGLFYTPGINKNITITPDHPSYSVKPELPSSVFRSAVKIAGAGQLPCNDPVKSAPKIYEIALIDENPPLRFPLGKDCHSMLKYQIDSLKKDGERFEHLSEGILTTDP
ncbi:NAD(P)-binding protein [Abortiporus biennis]|nr:NAD(P)-binding protein [Abortiporus biennis]